MIEPVRNISVPAQRVPGSKLVFSKEGESGSCAIRGNPAKYNAVALDFPSRH